MGSRVLGLDLSLTSTGVADNAGMVERIRSSPSAEISLFTRLRIIRNRIMDLVPHADLVVVESLAISRQTGQHLTRAGLWHLVMEEIDASFTPWAEVSPTALKRYATGKGNAGKDEVLAAVVRRFPDYPVGGNDTADALVLAAMGADHLGVPIVDMPQTHRTALAKVAWPQMPTKDGAPE
jgi:crossover junction endodeoxyribonuclease RuvC